MKQIRFILFLSCLFWLPGNAQNSEALKVTTFKLPNGLSIYLNEDHNCTDVFGAIAVKAGSKYDPADATGMGHYLEHLCFKGTRIMGTTDYNKERPYLDTIAMLYDSLALTKNEIKRGIIQKKINAQSVKAAEYAIPGEMNQLIKGIGGKWLNAFTGQEMIVYHNSFPGHQAEKWLDIYSERFINPVFRLFQSELEVVYEEKNRGSDNFESYLYESFLKHLYKKHPYGTNSTIGLTDHLKNPPLRRMQDYYNHYFVANNMALVLTGDFKTEEIIPLIKAKFSRWPSGDVPEFPKYTEEPFKGKEKVNVRMSPVKIGIISYRTVPKGHPDEKALEVCNFILCNQGESGLLDQIKDDGKIQYTTVFPLVQKDLGTNSICFVPKILRQSFGKAEKYIFNVIGQLRNNEYDDALFQAAKNNLRKEFYQQLEEPTSRALLMVNCFIMGESWDEFMKYPDQIAALSRSDIQKAAQKYYGENCLIYESKMGFPKKDKLKKPGFEPVKPKEAVKSVYAEKFDKLPSGKPEARFVNFNTDLYQGKLAHNEQLYVVNNPVNSIFRMKLIYHVNNIEMPGVEDAGAFLSYVGADTLSLKKVKMKMNSLGCTYGFYYSDNEGVVVWLTGLEDNVSQAVALLNSVMIKPKGGRDKLKLMVSDYKLDRKVETGDPSALNNLLSAYLEYGSNSSYLARTSLKVLSKKRPEDLLAMIPKMMQYPVSIHYSGQKNADEIKEILNQYPFSTASPDKAAMIGSNTGYAIKRVSYTESTIYVLNRKDARQTSINFYASLPKMTRQEEATQYCFNSYFGTDMSALVFQEIRELRSLAYACYMAMIIPQFEGHPNYSTGYIGCQGDKTKEALTTMVDLIRKMPEKPNKMDAIKSNQIENRYTARPFFRYLSEQVEMWKQQGYNSDPNELYLGYMQNLTFEDIKEYYKKNIQNMTLSIAILGNKDNIPMEELKKLGKVVVIEMDDIRIK